MPALPSRVLPCASTPPRSPTGRLVLAALPESSAINKPRPAWSLARRAAKGGGGPAFGGAFIRAPSGLGASCRARRGCLDDDRDDSANPCSRAARGAHQV